VKPQAAIDLEGEVLRPGDPGYDRARAVFNGMIDRRPLAILRCHTTSDVARGIAYARRHELPLSVRSGGHNVAGSAVCNDGIMLDLSSMRQLGIAAAEHTAQAGPGLLLGDLDRATQEHGLAVPLGVMSKTGIAGLTLGGGLGWLNARYGLACDNLLGAELVSAEGEVLQVNADSHADLLWGLRGGGGNFGVVTSFTYRLNPVGPVLAGWLSYPAGMAADAIHFHHQFLAGAPDELATSVSVGVDSTGAATTSIGVCWSGDHDEGMAALRALREFGPPAVDTIDTMSYLALQSAPDDVFPTGRQHYWKSGYLRHLTDDAVQTLLAVAAAVPPGFSGIGLQGLRGAASRVAGDATAFPHRAEQYDFLILAQWADPADSGRHITWARESFAAMQPHLENAVYVNNLGSEDSDRVHAAYGSNHQRLADLKRRYDPTNVFRFNQNVSPAAS
jgi:FAD/FMN-containing dehydrogenase